MRKVLFLFIAAMCSGFANPAYTQNTSAAFVTQALGARAVALGESYVAVNGGGVYAQYWNPASIAGNTGLQMAYTHKPSLFRDALNYEYFAASYPVSAKSNIAAAYNYVDFGRQSTPTSSGDFESVHSFSYVASVSYARQMAGGLAAGVTVKLISQKLGLDAQSWATDFGLIYAFRNFVSPKSSLGQLNLGASLSNLGQEAEFIPGQSDPLPRLLRLGMAYEFLSKKHSLDTGLPLWAGLVTFEYQNILNSDEDIWKWGLGAELKLFGIVAGRLGYHERHPKVQSISRKTFDTGTTFGLGAIIPIDKLFKTTTSMTFHLDYASVKVNSFAERYDMFTLLMELGIN